MSGEHGIGVTKLKYVDDATRLRRSRIPAQVDPGGVMNPGKLADPGRSR